MGSGHVGTLWAVVVAALQTLVVDLVGVAAAE